MRPRFLPTRGASRWSPRTAAEFPPLSAGPARLSALGITSTPITQELKPGEAYTTTLLFELPADAVPASLNLVEDILPTRLMIGHERSPLHGRALLPLPAPAGA